MMTRGEYIKEVSRLLLLLDIRHFDSLELCQPGAKRGDVVLQAPPPYLHVNMIPTIVRLEAVRRGLGGRIQCCTPAFPGRGYRNREYNDNIPGASQGSYHLKFNALDLVPLDNTTRELYDALCALPGSNRFGIRRYANRSFVHFDTRGLIEPDVPGWRVSE